MDPDKLKEMINGWHALHAEAEETDHALDWEAVDRATVEIINYILPPHQEKE